MTFLRRLSLKEFTAFENIEIEFSPGVNVFIGENGSGKSHLLKLLYVLHEAVRTFTTSASGDVPRAAPDLVGLIRAGLQEVFLPDSVGRLVRRAPGRRSAHIAVEWSPASRLDVTLSSLGRVTARLHVGKPGFPERAIFIPTREVLTLYPGFIAAYQSRESAFDRTYYDLCVALSARPLRGPREANRKALLKPLERALGGVVNEVNGRFYIRLPDGNMEVPLVAEGIRKLAMMVYLVVNGSLRDRGVLLWDEPEASLNPNMARMLARLVRDFARTDVQLFLATHDYALASELSLPDQDAPSADLCFFGLDRGGRAARATTFAELERNPILDALSSLHDREIEQAVRVGS